MHAIPDYARDTIIYRTPPPVDRRLGPREFNHDVTCIPVDRGIPMPPQKWVSTSGRRLHAYPWTRLQVGDSFVFPNVWSNLNLTQKRATDALGERHQKWPERYAIRRVEEDGETVVRIWRVA